MIKKTASLLTLSSCDFFVDFAAVSMLLMGFLCFPHVCFNNRTFVIVDMYIFFIGEFFSRIVSCPHVVVTDVFFEITKDELYYTYLH